MGFIVPTDMHPERDDQPMPYDWFVALIGAHSSIRSVCSTANVAGWVNELSTMMEPVWPGWRTGCGPCRRDNRSASPWPSKCLEARSSKDWSNVASMFLRFIPSNLTGSGIVTVSREPRMTGAMPLSWPIPSVPISPVFVGSNSMHRSSYGEESAVGQKKHCSKTFVAVPIGSRTSYIGCIPRCSNCARPPMRPGCGS